MYPMESQANYFPSVINGVCQTHTLTHTKEKSISGHRANALHKRKWKVNTLKLFFYWTPYLTLAYNFLWSYTPTATTPTTTSDNDNNKQLSLQYFREYENG